MRFRSALTVVLLCAATAAAHACSITFDATNSTNGAYVYNVVEPGSYGYNFSAGQKFTFTGLSGVTGVSTAYSSYFSTSYTSNSATFTLLNDVHVPQGTYRDVFTINSSVLTAGNVHYALSNTSVSGSISGPVASAIATTPEPSSLALLGTGLLGVVGAVRRRMV